MQNPNDSPAQAIARVREQWGAVIQSVAAVCQGDKTLEPQLLTFLGQMDQKDDWRALINVLRRILAGERDALELLRGLDGTDTLVAGDVLRALGVDVPIAGADDDDDGRMMSLERFLQQVILACKPDAPPGLMEQMQSATRGMATQPDAPPELRELGQVLNQILLGARQPDLSALHPQLLAIVQVMLEELKATDNR